MNKIIQIIALILCFTNNNYSQHNYCGTKDTDMDTWLETLEKLGGRPGIDKNLHLKGSDKTYWVPIHYHVMRKGDGTGQYNQYWILIMNCELNEAYSKTNIKFYIDKISYHNIEDYYKVSYGEDIDVTFNLSTLNHCNVYLTDDPAGNCGYTRRPSGTNGPDGRFPIFLAASRQNISCCQPGGKTLPHEMGHWLDLPHTFFGWEGKKYNSPNALDKSDRENVPRTGNNANCNYRGDGFCDTDPDYISDRWNCPNNTLFTDPLGNTFNAVGWNYMSYANDECISNDGFSPNQILQMNYSYRYPDRKDLYNLPAPIDSFADSISNVFPLSSQTIKQIKNNFKLSFDKVKGADFYQITIAKGTSTLNLNYNFPQNQQSLFIVDTIIDAINSFIDIPASNLISLNNEYFYYRIIPFSKVHTCPSNVMKTNYFKMSTLDIDYIFSDITCSGLEDGRIEIINKGNIPGLTYKINGVSFNGTQSNLKAGTYIIDITETNGNVSQFNIKVTDYGKPIFKIAKIKDGYNVVGVNGKQPYKYIWSNGTKESSTPAYTSIKSVTVTDSYNCDSVVLKIETSSIQDTVTSFNFNIYPNPLKLGEKLSIKKQNPITTNSEISIYNSLGQLVFTTIINKNNELNWIPKSKGNYLISIKSEKESTNYKLIVD